MNYNPFYKGLCIKNGHWDVWLCLLCSCFQSNLILEERNAVTWTDIIAFLVPVICCILDLVDPSKLIFKCMASFGHSLFTNMNY